MKNTLLAIAALFVAGVAHAQTAPVHVELGYTGTTIEEADATAHPGMLRGIVGVKVHPNIGIEAMIGRGIYSDDVKKDGIDTPTRMRIEHSYGVYVKPSVQITPNLQLFARLGYAHSRVKLVEPGGSRSDSEGDISYGAGLSYQFTPRIFGAFDYMSYYSQDGVKADGFTFGVGYRF